jgi:hypothetical protein
MEVNKIITILNHILEQKPYQENLTEEDYRILRANQLSGSIYPLIKDQKDIFKGFQEDYYRYIQRDEIHMQLIEEIRNIFNDHQIDFIFLKGSFLKTIYPHSYMRAMGDIDILVRPDKMDDIHKILEEHQFKNWTNSTNHDCFVKHKVNVEIHPKLDSEFSDEYKDLFLKPWEYAKILDIHEYHLNNEYRFFFQIYHMIKHLYSSGVGLRTFIDLVLLVDQLDAKSNDYMDLFELFPKKDFVIFIQCLLQKIFTNFRWSKGLKCDKINQNTLITFLNYITHSGTHGIGDDHNLFIGGMASSHKKKEWIVFTKIKFLFSKAFLPFSLMKGSYRYLNKYPFLLPVAYLQRIFKLLFKKSSRRKLKRMTANKDDIQYVEKLFIDIGLK